jgi:hypothetical protein
MEIVTSATDGPTSTDSFAGFDSSLSGEGMAKDLPVPPVQDLFEAIAEALPNLPTNSVITDLVLYRTIPCAEPEAEGVDKSEDSDLSDVDESIDSVILVLVEAIEKALADKPVGALPGLQIEDLPGEPGSSGPILEGIIEDLLEMIGNAITFRSIGTVSSPDLPPTAVSGSVPGLESEDVEALSKIVAEALAAEADPAVESVTQIVIQSLDKHVQGLSTGSVAALVELLAKSLPGGPYAFEEGSPCAE